MAATQVPLPLLLLLVANVRAEVAPMPPRSHRSSLDNLTLERNGTRLVCDRQKMEDHERLYLRDGQTVELTCDNVGPNQMVQWAYERRHNLVLIDDETPSANEHQLVKNSTSLLLTVNKHSEDDTYFCLEMQQHRCELHGRFSVCVPPELIVRSVGDSLELNCSDGDGGQTPEWRMNNALGTGRESQNSTLMFPSLTLDHSGSYTCELSVSDDEDYYLFVCPESEPPAVELVTGGESLTLHCGVWNPTGNVLWFVRSNRTGGRVFNANDYRRPGNMHLSNANLAIRNVSLLDSGEFWCVVMNGLRCVFRSDTLVMLREPGVDHHLLRSVLLSVVILMMVCVVVGVMVWRSRRREQLPVSVEELELSPESD